MHTDLQVYLLKQYLTNTCQESENLCSVKSHISFSVFGAEMECLSLSAQGQQSVPGTQLHFTPLGEQY